ncbi:DUF21 domain-containing protein [Sesamum angolense]|uniref:DUF21 domain-containing protein n=1 Tax=Sesamum angolense TaxID=2727404 RepID=A0AAE1X941_9LAMI|nr:DUF21 domain-containing protein [Sesamum angolense]
MGLSMNAVAVAVAAAGILTRAFYADPQDIEFGNPWWFVYASVSCFLVLFAGIMSGLTLGLMSLGLVELEILQRSGTSTEKKQAAIILPVVQKQHQLLVTLLLCNAVAMEALPIYLDKLFHPVVAVILSVTFILAFGEIIPQAVCSRYGLAVGANCVWLVRILMIVCYPIAYPIGKILDCVLGHNDALFRRPQLKALVSIHSQEAGKGGELTHDEATIISGALDLTEKTAEEAMTPIESTFLLDVNSKLDWEAIGKILARGHSRIPVYLTKEHYGLLLVKSLLTVRAETETPVSAVSIRRMPRYALYDILNEFQKGSSHMAAVVKVREKEKKLLPSNGPSIVGERIFTNGDTQSKIPLLDKHDRQPNSVIINIEKSQQNGFMTNSWNHVAEDIEDGEVIGINPGRCIEELLQEEIVDETDVYVDVHKRIRVVAAAAASSVARAPSTRRATGQKSSAGGQGKQVAMTKKLQEDDSVDARAIRAVALEHSNDAAAAVVAVVEEVIPFLIQRSRLSTPLSQSIYVGESSEAPVGVTVETRTADAASVNTVGSAEVKDGLMSILENSLSMMLMMRIMNPSMIHMIGDPGIEETISGNSCPGSSIKFSSDSIPRQVLTTLHNVDMGPNQNMNLIQESQDISGYLERDFGTATNEENNLDKSSADGNNSMDETALLTVCDLTITGLESSGQLVEVPHMDESNLDKLEVSLSTHTASKMETASSIFRHEDEPALNATMSQSSQIHSIDVLEEIIGDARNNKKTLFMAMNSVISLMKEVELKEQAAEQAKKEAAIGGTHIMDKVKELKRMLPHAKEANDMHAGDVYGEKAILATELRELQSRVLSLSIERDKSLAVLDEMCHTLKVRLDAAENTIKSAEQEKLEKEKAAHKALAELELIMEKLREFLVDRGHVVDVLQGEIAVICQDVRKRKEKFDDNIPLSNSLFSSQTSFILASSNSSTKSLSPDQVEKVPERDDSLETQKKRDNKQIFEEDAAREENKALVDDGWDIFDKCDIDV